MKKSQNVSPIYSKVLFKVYDIDGDGLIGKEELFVILKSLVTNTTNAQLEQIVEKTLEDVASKHEGMIDFEDFKRILEEEGSQNDN